MESGFLCREQPLWGLVTSFNEHGVEGGETGWAGVDLGPMEEALGKGCWILSDGSLVFQNRKPYFPLVEQVLVPDQVVSFLFYSFF